MRTAETNPDAVACGWCRGSKFYITCLDDRISMECVTCRAKTYKRHAGWIGSSERATEGRGPETVFSAPKAMESHGHVTFDVVQATARGSGESGIRIVLPTVNIENIE